jgi:ABC-type uncharacterized transport system involved in gliding motility auxiliary subunit
VARLMVNRITGVIGWIGTALVFGAVFQAVALRDEWDRYGQWAAWAGLVCVLIYMAGQWRDVVTFYKGRSARYGTVSIVAVVVMLAILVAINYLGVRRNKRWDLTANQFYSLSDQTVRIIKSLDAPVRLTVYSRETDFDQFRDRLDEYKYQSDRVSVEYVDADRQPSRAKAAGIQTYGTILVEYKDKTEKVTTNDEQAITNGIIKAMTGEQRKIYFTQGHGEKDTGAQDRLGYSALVSALTNDNYGVEQLVLAQRREVPADATAVIVAGPRTDFLQPELDALEKYVARGGKVMVLLDPPESANSTPLTGLLGFLHDWGIDAGSDIVFDASGIGQLIGTDASVPVAAPPYPAHTITERFGLITAYPLARSVRPVEGGVNGHTAQPFVQTSAQSWAEADLKSLAGGRQVEFNADKGDKQGPVPLAAAVSAPASDVPAPPPANASPNAPEPPKPESRIVAFGDSDFAANYALGVQGNRDLFVNAVNWVAQQENLIAIRPREAADRRVTLTAAQHRGVSWLVLAVVPGLVLATGAYTWWRRR